MNRSRNKGVNMAFPFVAGLAVGAVAIIAYNNRDKIKSSAKKGLESSKELLVDVKKFAVTEGTKLKDIGCEKLESLKKEVKPAVKTTVKKTTKTTKPKVAKTTKAATNG